MMQTTTKMQQMAGICGAVLVFVVGLILLTVNSRFGATLRYESYDWSADLCSFQSGTNAVDIAIIYLDEVSHKELAQPFNQPWDRSLHARLLNRLTADGVRGVVFDIIFSDPGPNPKADEAFAEAIRENGHVILAADLVDDQTSVDKKLSTHEKLLTLPHEPFRKAALGWGFAQLQPDEDFLIREHRHGTPDSQYVSLAWAAGKKLGLKAPVEAIGTERWINYYGAPGQVPGISYKMALNLPQGYLHNKVIFIGARPMTSHIRERKDEFRSPYSNWFKAPVFMPAVEIHALTYLNLVRGDWLRRLPPVMEWLILLLGALFFGFFLTRFSPRTATLIAVAGVIAVIGLSALLLIWGRFWFPFLITVAAQAPLGLVSAFIFRSIEWFEQKRRYEQARKAAEERIREQAALLDKAQDAIMVHSLDGKTTYWNPSAEQLYGWTAEEMRQQTAAEMLFGADLTCFEEAFQKTLLKGEWQGELQQTSKTGRKIVVNSRWSRICDENGAPKAVLVISTDVTERKKLELQLWQAQRTKSIGALASGIVHDLNNTLTPVLMMSEMLRLNEPNEKRVKMLQAVELSVGRAAGMTKQILTFVRGCEGEMVVLQVKHIVRDLVKIIKDTFPKSLKIEVRIAPDLLPIKGDATQVHQVLLNLCVNARDAMPGGGSLLIEAQNLFSEKAAQISKLKTNPGSYVLLQVSDSGTGISPEIMECIFDPFFTTKEIGKGNGLGLATVLGIVKHHHGFIDVTSELGKGSIFSVYIPAVDFPVFQTPACTVIENMAGRGQLVLVADEEPLVRAIIEFVLQQNNYRVIQAENGYRAFELFSRHSEEISVVLLDIMMPEVDGITVFQMMKQLKPEVKLITISGNVDQDERAGEGSKGMAILAKPISVEKLLTTLNKVIGSE